MGVTTPVWEPLELAQATFFFFFLIICYFNYVQFCKPDFLTAELFECVFSRHDILNLKTQKHQIYTFNSSDHHSSFLSLLNSFCNIPV